MATQTKFRLWTQGEDLDVTKIKALAGFDREKFKELCMDIIEYDYQVASLLYQLKNAKDNQAYADAMTYRLLSESNMKVLLLFAADVFSANRILFTKDNEIYLIDRFESDQFLLGNVYSLTRRATI